jgi:hypothetical protein
MSHCRSALRSPVSKPRWHLNNGGAGGIASAGTKKTVTGVHHLRYPKVRREQPRSKGSL